MGRRNKERLKRIAAGLELPTSQKANTLVKEKMLTCKKCNHVVAESRARQHIRDCWNVKIDDTDPIPAEPPPTLRQIIHRAVEVKQENTDAN